MFAPDVHAQKLVAQDRVESLAAAAAPRDGAPIRVSCVEAQTPASRRRTTAARPRSSPA